jgi:ribosome-associated protein
MNQVMQIALKAVDDKKGIDVVALDISGVATFADYFLVCCGDSARQIQAIVDEVQQKLASGGHRPAHVEGYTNAEWVLMDYGDLIVHVFSRRARAYYDLERLWRDAKVLDAAALLAQEAPEPAPARRPRRRRPS